jgi:hypothetical protein
MLVLLELLAVMVLPLWLPLLLPQRLLSLQF